MNKLGIDCPTKEHKKIVKRLSLLKTTQSVKFGGAYYQDANLCQIHLITAWTEKELDDWLYKSKGIDYIGTFSMEAP